MKSGAYKETRTVEESKKIFARAPRILERGREVGRKILNFQND